jgi:putative ABC transport system permease protein
LKTAQAELNVLNQQYSQENPKAPDVGPNISTVVGNLQEMTVANIRPGLLVLSGAVGLVLLIACANVASLLLSRALARRKEIAVRTALGAQRGAIIRQLLVESVILAFVGGIVGLGLSYIATHYLATLGAANLPQGYGPNLALSMDARVLLFMLSISLVTGIAFGIFPALQLAQTNVIETLRDEGRGTTGGHSRTELKSLLVIGQVAISMLLLVGAGLLVRSFSRLLNVDPGFDARNVITMNLSLPTVKYSKPEQQVAFFDDVRRRVSSLPGVQALAVSAALPLTPKRLTPILPEGQPEKPLAERPFIIIEAISPGWFSTLHVPMHRGRDFTEADKIGSPNVVIINEALARRFFPNQNPIGRHIVMGRQTASEIVGVAGDVKNSGLAQDPQVQLYFPFAQLPWGNMNLLVRTAGDPHNMIAIIREQISAADADQPVTDIRTVDELMGSSRTQPRFAMFLLTMFSATALVLAVVGIYGVLAYSVAQRRQELGIRMALGAKKSDILQLVVRQGLTLTAVGVVIGLVAAAALTRLMASLLYKVGAWDPVTFLIAPLVFLLIGIVASYLPARRAITVDPTEALR